ncbi:LysR family transcriptional regulator [Inquilinus sp. CAU 1745]|uniref:LysR family transcriptional regulator n=1 Tax=Inquilinus sp. CAU 1745 TaxID=3140369 RepID=UPI00325B8FBC
MELTWLEDFAALARTGNFSRAAEARNVTQPAFSRRIRALEDWIGAPLFLRTPRGVSLTPAGEHFRPRAEALARDLHQLRRETLDVAGRESAALSFAATHALSFTFFPRWIREQGQAASSGALNLISDSMQACEQVMLRGEAQFLLCHHHESAPCRLDPERFASAVVATDVLLPLSAPDGEGRPLWPLTGKPGAPARRLAYSPESGLGRIVAANRPSGGDAWPEPAFISHLAATLLSMARAGEGVAWLPRTLAEHDLETGHLVEAGDETLHIPLQIRLFRPIARQSATAEALWEAVVEAS